MYVVRRLKILTKVQNLQKPRDVIIITRTKTSIIYAEENDREKREKGRRI